MYHLRKIKVLLATCLLACSSLWAQDTEITISGATASSYHNDAHRATNAIDGSFETIWHSNWDYIPSFPVTFVITLEEVSHVDYVRYTPRLSGTNGNWKVVKVSYSTSTSGTDFTSPVEYDLKGASSTFDFPIGTDCGQIKFTIYPGATDNGKDLASAAEIAAYAYDTTKPAAFAEYFTDNLYTQLKSGVTSSTGIADADVQALVEAMLTDAAGYKKFRVGEYEAYMTTATVRNNLKTNSLYNNYENPTGIYLKRGESCIVAVSGIGDYPVGLKIKDWYKSGDLSTYKLHNGLNYITATTEGNVFVDYYTDDFEIAPNVQMHFINAPVLGYWDQATMTNEDWVSMLAGPLAEDDVIIITRSEHAQVAYPVKQWKTYCPTDVNSTMTFYQQVQWAERDMLGLEMFDRQVKNRQLFYADKSGDMYAGGDASVCGYGDLRVLVTPDAKVFDFWGVGHEWGHNNQMTGFHWSGCGETTNNIPASWAQFHFTGNRNSQGKPAVLRLEDEVTGINDYVKMRGGRMQTYFEEGLRKGVAWQLQDGPDYHNATPETKTVTGRDADGNDLGQVTTTSRNYDHFVKLSPFWQLNLWGTLAGRKENIIPKVIEEIRKTENYTQTYNTNGKQQINWMKLACQAAEMDLLPFFEKAGMLRPIHAYIEDYGEGWNIITEEMIDKLKASVADEVAAGRYQAYPDEEINYINGHNYHIYRDNLELNVTAIQGERNGDKVTIQHSVAQNAVAFETYNAQDELIRITMYGLGSNDEHSFTQVLFPSSFDESENAAYIMAVGYDGERQRVYQTYANEDEAKYGELGRILTGVEAMQALCDDAKVGYYKSSALTDLNAAYDIAKAVYDNKQSAKYAAVYDMLNTEFMKVQNDATARVGIVEGNAYRLTNRAYATLSMAVETSDGENKDEMFALTTAETDAQLWYFEASDTEGRYYLKNKSTEKYPGNVTSGAVLKADKTKDEAYAYELRDMGDGIWALVGATGLHCSASQSYNIVGWGTDAHATQWYITVIETNTNAEALNNLQVLVDKAEALIAEIEADGAYSTISTATAQSKVATAKNYIASGTYNESVYTQLNDQYTALLNAKKSVDNAALDAKKLDLSTLIGNANSLIAQCGTVTFNAATPDTELALQANYPANSWYVSSNADHNTGTADPDGGGIFALVDDDYNTYFHTRWGGGEISEPHYIQVDMGQGKTIQEFVFSYTPRSGSPAPTAMKIYGSNDAASFTEVLATITSGLPAHDSGKSYTSSTINSSGAAYRYLRFVVTGSEGPGNAQYGGQYFFGMMEFDITEKAKPEGYTVTLGNEAGDVTEELLLTAFKAVQEAQSVFDYANTEAQVNEAIEKLQAQYTALYDAKNSVVYVEYTISTNVAGGGVNYKEQPYTTTLTAPNTLTTDDLTAIEVEGYPYPEVDVNHETGVISVTYTLDKSALGDLLDKTRVLIDECGGFVNSEFVTEDFDALLREANTAWAIAQEAYENVQTPNELGDALNALQTVHDKLYTSKESAMTEMQGLLSNLIRATETLIYNCYEAETFRYEGSLNVTEALIDKTNEVLNTANKTYDSEFNAEDYESALHDLTIAKQNLATAIAYATLPVQLTFDASSPVTYKIKIARANTTVLAYDASSAMVAVTTYELGNKSHAWYFMATTDGKVLIMPYHDRNTTLALSTNEFAGGNSKVKGMPIGEEGYTQEWTITNTYMNEANRNAGWYNITTINPTNTNTTWYFSNHGGAGNKMGFYNDANDDGSRFQFEKVDFSKSDAYYTLSNYYHNEVKVSGTVTGGTVVGCYPEAAAEAYNTAYRNAANVLENATATDEEYTNAYNALKAANEALNLIMPEVGKYYTIVSACDDNNRNGQLMYATGENGMKFSGEKTAQSPEALWTFTEEGYMMNLQTGCYVGTSQWATALTLVENGATVVSFESLLTSDGQVMLKPGNSYPLHAQVAGSTIVGYVNDNNASAWRIEEVDMSAVKHTATLKYEHAGLFLNYAVAKPAGVKAYYIDGTKEINIVDGVGELKLTELEGEVIPARTAVILYAPEIGNDARTYDFYYTADDSEIDNLLTGSAYTQYLAAEADHAYYSFGQSGGQVGLYKNSVKYDAAGAEGTTHYKMSANKVLFDYWDNTESHVTSFRFSIGDETGIEGITIDADATIYDLYGRRVLEVVTPGLYIINGEKRYINIK